MSIGDAVISADTNGKVFQMNLSAEKLLNIKFSQDSNVMIYDILSLKQQYTEEVLLTDSNSFNNNINKLLNTHQCILITNKNEKLVISINAEYIKDENLEIHGFVFVLRNITVEHKLKQEAQENETFFRTIFEISPFYMTIQRLSDLKYVMVNKVFADNYNTIPENFIDKTPSDLGIETSEEDIANYNKLIKEMKLDNILKVSKKNNHISYLLYSARIINYKDEICTFTIASDITEIKKLQEQLNHAQKMDAIGQLAGGIAHDFNNIIGGMLGIIELMTIKEYTVEDRKRNLQILLNSGQRASELTKKLLMFARKGKIDSTLIDVHKAIKEAVALLERTINKKVHLHTSLNSQNPNIIGDFTQIMNIVLNMGINADHAMPNGGDIAISTIDTFIDLDYCKMSNFKLKPGNYIKITITDTGMGISTDHLDKIFEPFFTTKEQGKGTGLGLAAVYDTVSQHHGEITVDSTINKGTSFHILLPASEASKNNSNINNTLYTGSGTILLVDDEYIIQVMAKAILENLGYRVLVANDGKEALDLYKSNADIIKLVILDMVMPEMNGKECFNRLRMLNPDLKIILSSGFTQENDLEDLKREGLNGFIKKPYSTSEISKLIKDIL